MKEVVPSPTCTWGTGREISDRGDLRKVLVPGGTWRDEEMKGRIFMIMALSRQMEGVHINTLDYSQDT